MLTQLSGDKSDMCILVYVVLGYVQSLQTIVYKYL